MNALATITQHMYLARRTVGYTPDMREDAIHADVALLALIAAAEIGAAELIRAGKSDAGRTLLSAVSHFREPVLNTRGVLKGNADLVQTQHTHLIAQPEDKL